MCDEPTFTPTELELLSDLLGSYLETDDLNQREFGTAKSLSEKVEGLLG